MLSGSCSAMQHCHSARNRVSKKERGSGRGRKGERKRERERVSERVSCYISTSITVTEAAAPLMACSGCQLLQTIQFCSTTVYSRLVTELRMESSKFFFQPDDCLTTATGRNLYTSTGPDCMPPPQGLPSGTGEYLCN